MGRFHRVTLVFLLLCGCIFAASMAPAPAQKPGIQPHKDQKLLAGKATEFRFLFANHTKQRDHHEDEGEDPNELRQAYYVLPRAYPEKKIDHTKHSKAMANLRKMRTALNHPHVKAGFLSPTIHADKKSAGPAGSGGISGPGVSGPAGLAPNLTSWVSAGPTNINGRVTCLAIDPNNTQHLFATTVGGIWRSQDGSRRWQRVSDDFLIGVCACVAINPGNGKEVFVGTGEPNYSTYNGNASGTGIWHSTSSGDPGTWSKVTPAELDNQTIFRIRIDPTSPNNLYAATSAGLYLGTRTGTTITWARLKGMDAWTTDMAIDFSASPHTVYAGISRGSGTYAAGVWKYDGTSWQKRDTGISTGGRTIALALAPTSPKTLYAKLENAANGRLLGLFKTVTGGESVGTAKGWSSLPGGSVLDDSQFTGGNGYCWYNSIIEVDPADANTVYCGGVGLYRSTNGGTTWASINQGADPKYQVALHGDHHTILFDPKNSKNLFVGNDGGVFHALGTFGATWHWNDVSHGMVMTQFYRITTQHSAASIIAGGSQDNGTEITFGNRTWYNPGGCDGADVAIDAGDNLTLYLNCNGGLSEVTNPVPGTTGAGSRITWKSPATFSVSSPLITDPIKAGASLAAGAPAATKPPNNATERLLKTTDGITWSFASPAMPTGDSISFIAVAPSSSFQTYYLGVSGPTPAIWRTVNGGTKWTTTSTGLPAGLRPNAIAVDFANAKRAVVGLGGAAGGSIAITTDTGATWHSLNGSGTSAFPANTPVTGIVFDPFNANTVYISTTVGVFKGTISKANPPTASWVPFDDGLPEGVDVNDISVNRATGILHIGTMGYGAYRRDVKPGLKDPQVMLVVRDNVFDHGHSPSTPKAGFPDPEHPVADSKRPGFYKPGDPVFWWSSPDIRIDVPSQDPVANQLAAVDHVEFESTPLNIAPAVPGTLLDSGPERGQAAKVYVQVSNRGLQPATQVKVLAIWADASAGLPLLPKDFWTKTFPAGSGKCGPLATGSGWHFVDAADPCKVIPVINPIMPEVAGFNWSVPASAASHTCVMAIVESDQDPIEPSIRKSNELRPWVLIPESRHVGQRNLHIVSAPANQTHSHMLVVNVPNPHPDKQAVEMHIAAGNLHAGGTVGVILPAKMAVKSTGIAVKALPFSDAHKALAAKAQLDHTAVHTVTGTAAHFSQVPIPAGQTIQVGLVIQGGNATPGTAHHVTITTHDGDTLLGGSTYMLRVAAP